MQTFGANHRSLTNMHRAIASQFSEVIGGGRPRTLPPTSSATWPRARIFSMLVVALGRAGHRGRYRRRRRGNSFRN